MTRKRYDPTDPDQVARQQQTEDLRVAQFHADWVWMLDDPRGRRILGNLLLSTNWLGQSYVPGDALATAFNEGRRATAAVIYAAVSQAKPYTAHTPTGQDALVDILKELTGANG